jgi:hypothetical protein
VPTPQRWTRSSAPGWAGAAHETSHAGLNGASPALVAIAVDGKTVRGATDTEGNQVPLLAAATHRDALVGRLQH